MSRNKKAGNAGQEHAAAALRRLGVLQVEETEPTFVITRRMKMGETTWCQGYYKAKIAADLRGITDKGISVMAEVKTIWDRNLQWGDFKPHQPERLSEHAEHAISLVVWVHDSGIFVMDWRAIAWERPISISQHEPLLRPGRGLKPEEAESLNLESLENIR